MPDENKRDDRVKLPDEPEAILRALLTVDPNSEQVCDAADCLLTATHTCSDCDGHFCEGHLKHPEHTRPL